MTGEQNDEQVKPETVNPEIIRFDNNGDLRLLVTQNTLKGPRPKVFVVSSKAMSMACDAWNSMLNGQFKESQQPSSGEREVELPEDDPHALEILLNIAHLRFDLVPLHLKFTVLLKVTVLTDKYDMTHLIRPWATSWIQPSENHALHPGYEEWLWIAWELGQTKTFEALAAHLVNTVKLDKDGRCMTENKKSLDPCGSSQQHLPPDIIGMLHYLRPESCLLDALGLPDVERIMYVRLQVISDLLEYYYTTLELLVAQSMLGTRCQQGFPNHDGRCDALVFGSLSLGLRWAGLGLERVQASTVTKSVAELLVSLKTIKVSTYHRHDNCSNSHLNKELLFHVEKVEKSIPSAVTYVHHNHLMRQAKKLGYA